MPGWPVRERDFRWYEVLSRLMLAIVREFSPRVEYYSIDEFFFEATPPPGMDYQRAMPKSCGTESWPGSRSR